MTSVFRIDAKVREPPCLQEIAHRGNVITLGERAGGLNTMGDRPHGLLAEALASCGVDPAQVDVEWDALCQEDALTFSGVQFSEDTLARLAELFLTFPSRFVFASDDLQDAFEHMVRKTPYMLRAEEESQRHRRKVLETRGLSNFEAFDPGTETLTAFAARAEAACGFSSGAMLSVSGDGTIYLAPSEPEKLKPDDLSTVLWLLMESAPEVPKRIVGREAS